MDVSTLGESSSSEQPRSLNRQAVLDEDEYTEALSQIIARDFFPSLVHLDATNDYLDALRSHNPQLIDATVRRLEELSTPRTARYPSQTPGKTPYGGGPSDTPLRTPRNEPPLKKPRYNTDLSLDNFQARYTSEDNASFTHILDEENRKRREKWAWAWEAQKRVEEQRDKMLEGRERLLLEAPTGPGVRERFVIEAPTPAGLLTAGPEGESEAVQAGGKGKERDIGEDGGEAEEEMSQEVAISTKKRSISESEEVVDVMAPKKDTRPAGVDGWQFKARNALMFPPDADESPYHLKPTPKPTDGKLPPPKVIKYGNTRLPEQDDTPKDSISEPPSPTRSRIDAAIMGTPYRPRSPTTNNNALVPSLPSPTPSQLGPAAVKQLMTWGTLNATPRVLSGSDIDPAEAVERPPPATFQIAPPSARERLSQKLSNSASKSLRAKAELLSGIPGLRTPSSVRSAYAGSARKGSMPPPSWTPRRAEGALTPAARRLLDRTAMSTAASRRAEAMDRASGWERSSKAKEQDLDRVRWTPTPSPVTRRA